MNVNYLLFVFFLRVLIVMNEVDNLAFTFSK